MGVNERGNFLRSKVSTATARTWRKRVGIVVEGDGLTAPGFVQRYVPFPGFSPVVDMGSFRATASVRIVSDIAQPVLWRAFSQAHSFDRADPQTALNALHRATQAPNVQSTWSFMETRRRREPRFVRLTDLTLSCAAGPACRSRSGAAVAANVRRTESRSATAVTPSRWR